MARLIAITVATTPSIRFEFFNRFGFKQRGADRTTQDRGLLRSGAMHSSIKRGFRLRVEVGLLREASRQKVQRWEGSQAAR
jgi:hypothetical protein